MTKSVIARLEAIRDEIDEIITYIGGDRPGTGAVITVNGTVDEPDLQTELLSESEALKLLGVSRTWLYQQRQAGRLAFVSLGKKNLRYRRTDLLAMLDDITVRNGDTKDVKSWLWLSELAEETGIPVRTFRHWRITNSGGPPSYLIGRRVAYDRDDLQNWLKQNQRDTNQAALSEQATP